jgi:DNA-binding NtrC family response regulator
MGCELYCAIRVVSPLCAVREEGNMNQLGEVVVVSANSENRRAVVGTLARLEVDAICVPTVEQYREIAGDGATLVFCDRHLPDGDFRDVLAATARSAKKAPNVVMMARYLNLDSYDQAKRAGIFEAIPTPCRPTDIEWMVILTRKQ